MRSFLATLFRDVFQLYGVIQKDFLPAEDTGRLLVRTQAGDDASYDALLSRTKEKSQRSQRRSQHLRP